MSVRINTGFPFIAARTAIVRCYMLYKDLEEKEFFIIVTSRETEDIVQKFRHLIPNGDVIGYTDMNSFKIMAWHDKNGKAIGSRL